VINRHGNIPQGAGGSSEMKEGRGIQSDRGSRPKQSSEMKEGRGIQSYRRGGGQNGARGARESSGCRRRLRDEGNHAGEGSSGGG